MDEKKERGPFVKKEEDFNRQERPSDLQNELDALTIIVKFKLEGHRAHDLIERIARRDKPLAKSIEEFGETPEIPNQTPYEESSEDCWNHSRRYDIKRRDARTVNTLLYRNWPG